MNCSIPSSLALSALTNSVYSMCDIWNGLNTLSSYTYILQSKIQDTEYVNDKVRMLWQQFSLLQKTDFNKKVEAFQKRKKEYKTTKDWFDAVMKEINSEIKHVMTNVRYSMKESKAENDILHYCQSMLHEACLIRTMLCSAQSALFEAAQASQITPGGTLGGNGHTPGGTSGGEVTKGGGGASMMMMTQSSVTDPTNTKQNTLSEKFGGYLGGFFTTKK